MPTWRPSGPPAERDRGAVASRRETASGVEVHWRTSRQWHPATIDAAALQSRLLQLKVPEAPVQQRAAEHGPRPASPAESVRASSFGGRPHIQSNERQLRDIRVDALAALTAANDPPRLFTRSGARCEFDRPDLARDCPSGGRLLYSCQERQPRELSVPIYEYVCSACGKAFEQLVRTRGEERKVRCPACGEKRIERQFSVIAAPRAAAQPLPQSPCRQCEQSPDTCPYQ